MEKKIKKYVKIYRKVLSETEVDHIQQCTVSYERRLSDMYNSDSFQKHNVYPTTDMSHIYAVIAMCLELKELGMADPQIIDVINKGFRV